MKNKVLGLVAGGFLILAGLALQPLHAEFSAGQTAPDFALPDSDGKFFKFNDYLKGRKAILINFWATWCPSCKHEIPRLIALQSKYSEKSFSVLGVDVGESGRKVSAFKTRFSINYPVLIDGSSEISKKYGVVGLPVLILMDSNGKVLKQYHEYSDELEKDIAKVLS